MTNGEFRRFLQVGQPPGDPLRWSDAMSGLENFFAFDGQPPAQAEAYPAVAVSHAMARAFARSHFGRMPTSLQWEYAARSGGKPLVHVFAWMPQGRRPAPGDPWANLRGIAPPGIANLPIPLFPVQHPFSGDVTEQGVLSLAGNAREWCRDAAEGQSGSFLVRGGSFRTEPAQGDPMTPAQVVPDDGTLPNDLGFRIVLECPDRRARGR